jgi:DNA-binding NtrC family response regulator
MSKSLLIVSADNTFAQVLLHGLEQEGYRVQITRGKGEAVVRADEENSSLAFLDMDLGYRTVLEIGQSLRMLNPEIRLLVFTREGTRPALDELRPWMFSPKPYFLPDVLNMLNNNSTLFLKILQYTPSSGSSDEQFGPSLATGCDPGRAASYALNA